MYLKASINIKKLAVTQMMVSSDSCVPAARLSPVRPVAHKKCSDEDKRKLWR